MHDTIQLSGVIDDSIVDGPGLRFVIFTQGCTHHCPQCHNTDTHDISKGYTEKVSVLKDKCLINPLSSGITLSGGEPFLQPEPLAEIASFASAHHKNVWIYTGYTWEELLSLNQENKAIYNLLSVCDVLVDGRFIAEKKSYNLMFRGSSNQRVIDVQESLKTKNHQCILLSKYMD